MCCVFGFGVHHGRGSRNGHRGSRAIHRRRSHPALDPIGKGLYGYFRNLLGSLSQDLDFSLDTPWEDLEEEIQQAVLHGNNFEVVVKWRNRYGRDVKYSTGFEGVLPYIERKYRETESDWAKQRYAEYLREIPCSSCHGARLKPEVLAVTVSGQLNL